MIIIFCGIPGSGKSTIASKLEAELNKIGPTRRFISDDLKTPVYRKFFQLLQENRDRYEYLIFDGTFYKKEWRDKIKRLAGSHKVITVYVECPLEVAVVRNRERQTRIPERAVHIISSKFEAPNQPNVKICTNMISPSDALIKILEEMERRRTEVSNAPL